MEWITRLERLFADYGLNAQLKMYGLASLVDVQHMEWFRALDPKWLKGPADDDTKPTAPFRQGVYIHRGKTQAWGSRY